MTSSQKDMFELLNSGKSQQIIMNLREFLCSEDIDIMIESMESAQTLFLHFLNMKNAYVDDVTAGDGSQKECITHMENHYHDFKSLLMNYLHHDDDQVQIASLDVLMRFIQEEGKYMLKEKAVTEQHFPKEFSMIVCKIIKSESDAIHLIDHFKSYLEYKDVKLQVLKPISEVIETQEIDENEQFMRNLFNLICRIRFSQPSQNTNSEDLPNMFITRTDSEQFVFKHGAFKLEFSKVWVNFLKKKLSTAIRKKILLHLPKRVLPHLKKPLHLTDFFTDSYSMGGMLSLLALSGIFFLMQKYNLDYPDFYKQLYALFNIDIIRSKYNRRFFDSAYMFLTSALLPEYIVAAFVKRLARLSLYAPTDVIFIIIPFMGNLLIRHPSLKVLINDQHEISMKGDPFDFEELDFEKCNAMQSSLWEIKSLQTHWHPDIAKKANCINSELRPIEWDLTASLDMDFCDIVEREQKMKHTDFPLSTNFYNL